MFYGYFVPFDQLAPNIIEINDPNILSPAIIGDLWLCKLLLVNVSSLVEADLHYIKARRYKTTRKEEKE